MASPGRQFQHLFHGTAALIQPGDRITSATKRKAHSTWGDTGAHQGQPSKDHAFATAQELTAWKFAHDASSDGDAGHYADRPRVYKVHPNPRMKEGVHHDLKEFVAPSFKVHEHDHRLDIMPGQQGTITGEGAGPYNWNQHRPDHHWEDINHPQYPFDAGPARRNVDHRVVQNEALNKAKPRELPGQTEMPATSHLVAADRWDPQRQRAAHHLLRDAVNSGTAPPEELDHKLAEDESLDAFNARKGRRSNFAKRNRERSEISPGGAL